jgi:hypothetical protein
LELQAERALLLELVFKTNKNKKKQKNKSLCSIKVDCECVGISPTKAKVTRLEKKVTLLPLCFGA